MVEHSDSAVDRAATDGGTQPEEAVETLRKVAADLARQAIDDKTHDNRQRALDEQRVGDVQLQGDMRIVEAVLFATDKALSAAQLADQLPDSSDIDAVLEALQEAYAQRGVNLVRVGGKWMFRTASDLSYLLERHAVEERRLSRAALETLAIIAYHQPATRAEIEEVRGVTTSRGTLDALMEVGWVRPRGRRRAPGKPVTYGTTEAFLVHFGIDSLRDLPGLAELEGAGLLDANLPADFRVPQPQELAALMPDELALEDDDEDQVDLAFEEDVAADDDDGEDSGRAHRG